MKVRRDKYQQGSVRRVKRANGFAWEFRYYVEQDGKRLPRSQYFDGKIYKTEKAVRQRVEAQLLKLNEGTEYARANDVTFNALLDRYIAEEMPARHATKGSYTSIIKREPGRSGAATSSPRSDQQRFTRGSSRSTLRP